MEPSKANILIVDDRTANLIALAETLAPLKQNVVIASSGNQALKHLLQEEFAVILLDVQMPGMDGFELAKIIRSRPNTCHIPIIFLTAINRDPFYISKGYAMGAVDYLIKPIIPEFLLAKVSVFVDLFNKTNELNHQTKQLAYANHALQEKQQEVIRLNHYNQLILDSVGEGIYGINRQGKTTFLNPAAARLLGYTVDEVIGKSECEVLYATSPQDSKCKDLCPICDSLQDGSVHRNQDGKFYRKDGSCLPVEYVSTPILEKGEPIGAVITFQDATERRSLEHMKDEFISIVGHELKTPLTTIQGSLKLLASGLYAHQPEKAQGMLKVALRGTDRLIHVINDILDLQCLATGNFAIHKRWCDELDLIQLAVTKVQSFADQSQIQLNITSSSTQLWVDPGAIAQVLTNLLHNAIKFSPPNTTVSLTARTIESDEVLSSRFSPAIAQMLQSKFSFPCILFSIEDEGCGIPAHKLEAIFERFQQVDTSDSRKQGGSGLGLAICKGIVQLHSGYIWAESVQGQGSIFHVAMQLLPPQGFTSG